MVEGPYLLWFKTRGPIQLIRLVCLLMCTVTEGHYAITIGHCSIQQGVWGGSGGALGLPATLGQRLGGGAKGEAPGSSENIVFYSTGERA